MERKTGVIFPPIGTRQLPYHKVQPGSSPEGFECGSQTFGHGGGEEGEGMIGWGGEDMQRVCGSRVPMQDLLSLEMIGLG